MNFPKVSILMGTFNHAPFVRQAVMSVLNQTYEDFEFLIADDGSSDQTADEVLAIKDPRIQFWRHVENRGACVVLNELRSKARGTYVAILNSDDHWPEDKLSHQVKFLSQSEECAALFGRAVFVDRDGDVIPKGKLPIGGIFDVENRSSARWLRRFFEHSNCLCHPTVLLRRECLESVGLYDNRYRQLPDFDLWIRLVKRYSIHISDRTLVYFRVLPGENASSATSANVTRSMNECLMIAHDFFDGVSAAQLTEGFGDLLKKKNGHTSYDLEIEKALLCFSNSGALRDVFRVVGLSKIHALLGQDDYRSILAQEYGIDDKWFHARMAELDVIAPTLRMKNEVLEREIAQLFNSRSWRVTAPLRDLAGALSRWQYRWSTLGGRRSLDHA